MTSASLWLVQNADTRDPHLEEHLRGLGYETFATSSGQRAVEGAAAGGPDMAVVDLGLEGDLSGIETAERLRNELDVPVIYLVDGDHDSLERSAAAEPYGYVLKPVEPQQLHWTIQLALAQHRREIGRRESDRALQEAVLELRRKARVMEAILNSSKEGMVAIDEHGRVLFANARSEEFLGAVEDVKPGDLYGAPTRQIRYGLFEPDGEAYVSTDALPLARAVRGESTDDREMVIRNGQIPQGACVSVRGRTLWREDGAEIAGGIVLFRDITAEKEATARLQQTVGKLREQTDFMETVLENMNEAVFVTASDGSTAWANSRMEEMLGVGVVPETPDEWANIYGVYYPDRQTMIPTDRLPILRALRGELLDDVQIYIRNERKPEGVWVNVTARPLRDESGAIRAGVVVLHDITQQKLAEEKLERNIAELRSQSRLMQTVFESMEEGVVVSDVAGNFLLTNERRQQIIGKRLIASEPTEWPSTYGAFLLDETTQVPTEQLPIVRAMRGESTEEIELFIRNERRPDGAYVRVRGRPLLDSEANIIGGVAIFSDITKYKQTEAELEQTIRDLQNQAQLMDAVFESISDGVVAANAEGQITVFNSSARRITGMGMVESSHAQWTRDYGLFKDDKGTRFPAERLPLLLAIRGEASDDVEMFVYNEQRTEGVYISVNGRPLLKNAKTEGGGVVTFRDVTDRKRSETVLRQAVDELRDQGELMEATFNGISDGLVMVGLDGKLLNMNPVARQILGIEEPGSTAVAWGTHWGDHYYPDRQTPIQVEDLPLYRAVVRGEPVTDEDVFVRGRNRRDGFFIRVNARPLLRIEGSIRGGVMIFRDVTEQLLAAEALTQAFAHGRLEIIDTILHNIGNAINSVTVGVEALQDTLKDNQLMRRLRSLVEVVKSHEGNWVEYLANDPQGQKVLPYLLLLTEGLDRQSGEMARTVERVADRARHIADIIRTQKAVDAPHMNRKDLNLKEALSSTVRVLSEALNRRGIAVELRYGDVPRDIRIEESQFHQMMVNLIKNSMEAIDQLASKDALTERPRIGIWVRREGEFLNLDVTDNGIGIDDRSLRMIFAAGYTTKKTGSGLGLHSAANFVIGSGGRITALSDGPGQGATVRVQLRLSSVCPAAHQPYAAPSKTR